MIEEIWWDRSFSRTVQRVAEQAFHSHTNNKITVSGTIDLADTKSTLHTLEEQEEGLTAFSTLEATTSEFDLDDDKRND